ncbi:hypothetical protein SUNI508_13665 [Seiridium unicorne]|uniref:histidine kinase n=1 Tax=Seiridium unicorne TaxID=138068 RepID=A0ABR2VBW4_9PEZI
MAVRMAYFPRGGAEKPTNITKPLLPARPSTIGPIFDTENSTVPLSPFDPSIHEQVYAGPSQTGEAIQPDHPARSDSRYLYPSLAQNERLRLTLLWYHTRFIEQDEALLAKIDTLVKGLQQAIGWDYAIAGIMTESTYTRLATAHLPIARLPRREATCAHTINQAPGSVFMITDMSKDWRFEHSPHVEVGGLRSYAGTQLRLLADDGEEIALGSLCVTSDTPQPPLSQGQMDLIVRFAEIISSAIASHTRQRRLKEREAMRTLLPALQTQVDLDYEKNAVEVVRKAYPTARVSLQISTDGKLAVDGRPPFAFSNVHEGLWEDSQYIEETINNSNHTKLESAQTVRAVVARCGSSDKYLIVASTELHHVFDDFDAWYVSRSASIIADTLQRRLLRQALEARETFLRGMTHQLRTPIHGILGSVELLAEELTSRHFLDVECGGKSDASISASPSECLATIKNSGQELMTTVNNILKHNTWTDAFRQDRPRPYDLNQLEADILPEILAVLPPEQLGGISIDFRQDLADGRCIITTDVQMLKDCLQAIILNAAQAVLGSASGAVSVTIRSTLDFSWLIIDVVDNGRGIDLVNHNRIFEPYEKVDSHKPGAGLGLTLASKIAGILNGYVKLISSALGSGSHFRIELQNSDIAAPIGPYTKPILDLKSMPRKFVDVSCDNNHSHFIGHITEYLTRNGFQQTQISDAALIVTNASSNETISELHATNPKAAIIGCKQMNDLEQPVDEPFLITANGPLFTQRLDRMLHRADELYKNLSREVDKQHTKSMVTTSPLNTIDDETPQSPSIMNMAQLSFEDRSTMPRRSSISPLRALLVDDNTINLRVLQMFCHKRRIPYVTAEDGDLAYQQYKKAAEEKKPFTLVLMDLQMPRYDGIHATSMIRSYENEHCLARSSIFMVTGQDSAKDKASSRSAGADEFLVKPSPGMPQTLKNPPEADTFDGVFIPGGTAIGHNAMAMVRSEKIFGADADLFRPERFLDCSEEKKAEMERTIDMIFWIGDLL